MPNHSVRIASTKNGYDFSIGVIKITKFHILLNTERVRKGVRYVFPKKYIIELEEYDGFAMVKYYPRHLKNDKRKFRCRGIGRTGNILDYFVPRKEMLKIMSECAILMKEFLAEKKFRLVGFIGMVDDVDNATKNLNSQRYNVYSPFVYSVFNKNDYTINNLDLFKEFNCLMVTNNLGKGLNKSQRKNFYKFTKFIEDNLVGLEEMMTLEAINNAIQSQRNNI